MKKVLILGSTGSIGTQALEIIRNNRDKFSACGLSCRSRVDDLIAQIREFAPESVCVGNSDDAKRVRSEFPNLDVHYGDAGLVEIAGMDCDIVLNALMGISGLAPTYEAISHGRDIALANKETLVAGGEIVTELCREKGVKLIPVDSEHSAIFQCLEGNGGSACARAYKDDAGDGPDRAIRRILLTASGGPFRGRTLDEMRYVTIEQALNHPNWSMGSKITIDSATMMNKGLEVIEARWLFDIPADKIDVHVHPESIVHSMVEFMDGSVIAQMGLPDMKIPIGLALNYPDRLSLIPEFSGLDEDRGSDGSLDFFTKGANLTFEKADRKTFRCLDIAYAAIREGGSAPVVMNGANEELVAMFLAGNIGFTDIPETIERVMDKSGFSRPGTVEEILAIDNESRIMARKMLKT
ncbi:MAG: 1-deoxy-D-xylulose-5-phosphate reductoisomerase [Mogibacterium sp.]|nr:1-deoxy-D-xylulose-5-phosphate reductoisomerase [Mogibacterium sp.]